MKSKKELYELESFDTEACDLIYKEISHKLSKTQNKLNIALSGGSTPLPILSLLKEKKIDWSRIVFFIVDERNVNIKSEDCNFYNLNNIFFKHIPSKKYQMISGEKSLEDDILLYDELLRKKVFQLNEKPRFDFIFLGMGLDGHTASIFPNSSAQRENKKLVIKNKIRNNDIERLTMTYPVLLNADQTIIIIKGLKKKRLLFDQQRVKNLPVDFILNNSKNIQILCSKE